MPTWRCPHCGTPQTETARCWVCRRSSTACGTCRHFRRSVAGQMGYCGLDRRRAPLVGDEIRACWDARPGAPVTDTAGVAAVPFRPASGSERAARLEFVEVGRARPSEPDPSADPADPSATAWADAPAAPPVEPGWNLWGDLEI